MFCADQAHVMASRKKLDFLRPLEPLLAKRSDLPDLKLYLRVKVRVQPGRSHYVIVTGILCDR